MRSTDAGDSSMSFRIELVDSTQAEIVLRLALEAFAEYRETLVPSSSLFSESVDDMAAYIERGGAVIAWDGETPVGAARFHPEGECLYVGRVSVPPAFRRQGIASAMMRFLEEHARALGLPKTKVETREALPGNVALYESLGYVKVAINPIPRYPSARSVTLIKQLAGD
jgi:ribosomal protein S18 acetylase RimI-like enzyme